MHLVRRRILSALAVGALGLGPAVAAIASAPPAAAEAALRTAASPGPGYWLAGADGGVFSFNAPFFGSGNTPTNDGSACSFSPPPSSPLNATLGCVAIASNANGDGYWLLNGSRSATPYGAAALNPASCTSLNGATGTWSGIAVARDGQGFWLVSSNGAVMGCGSMPPPLGGTTDLSLAAPIVGMAATPDRGGYWLVGADGGIFAFGDAHFYGSMGGTHLNAPIVGIAATADRQGYWLVAADGGVFTFGDARFSGSMGGTHLNAPIVGMAANPDGPGYWLAAADGGVFALGGAPFEGSMGGSSLTGRVVGIAARP